MRFEDLLCVFFFGFDGMGVAKPWSIMDIHCENWRLNPEKVNFYSVVWYE